MVTFHDDTWGGLPSRGQGERRPRFRAWYRCGPELPIRGERLPLTADAESEDGIHWMKPSLGLIKFEGSRENNLVWGGPGLNMAPCRDDNPAAPDDERYKAIVRTQQVLPLGSPDGLRWRLPTVRIRRYTLRTDGFVSVRGGYAGG